jgi:hypothetical protein
VDRAGSAVRLAPRPVALLVFPAAAARARIVAADLAAGSLVWSRAPRRYVEERGGLVGQGEAYLDIVAVEARLADRLRHDVGESTLVAKEKGRQCLGAGRDDLHVPLRYGSRHAVAFVTPDPRIRVASRHAPAVCLGLTPRFARQVVTMLEGERDPRSSEIAASGRWDITRRQEGAVARQRREDDHASTLAQLPDDRDASALDSEDRAVHAYHVIVVRHLPRGDREERKRGLEEPAHHVGADRATFQVARLGLRSARQVRREMLEQTVEFGRRGDAYGDTVADHPVHFVREPRIRDPYPCWPPRSSTRERLLKGSLESVGQRTLALRRRNDRLADDQPRGQLEPEHHVRPEGVPGARHPEGRRQTTADPFTGTWSDGRTRARAPTALDGHGEKPLGESCRVYGPWRSSAHARARAGHEGDRELHADSTPVRVEATLAGSRATSESYEHVLAWTGGLPSDRHCRG